MSAPESNSTRAKLLEAATRVFVDEGFEGASIRAIATRADANIAAVSYHFGGKEELYRSVIESAFARLPESSPMPRMSDAPNDPSGQLRAWIHWHFERVLGSGRQDFGEILMREMREPTPTMRDFCDRVMKPVFVSLCEILAAILVQPAQSRICREAALQILSQYVIYRNAERMIDLFVPEFLDDPESFVDGMAERVADFSVAGVRALADRLRTKK